MPIERLSKYDAIFYYSDTRRVAMQASVGISVDGPIDFERYLAWVSPRIENVPRMKMRLKPAPFGLRLPAWVAVNGFELREHIVSHRLDAPGTDDQLRGLIEDLIHQRLPHDKPLWRLHVVNGLEHNRAVLLLSWHHCMADAEGVFEMFQVLLETQKRESAPPNRVSKAGLTRLAHVRRPLHGLRAMLSRDGRRRLAVLARYARTRNRRFPFTRPVSGRVNVAWRQIPMEEFRAAGNTFGTTATDVVLAALGAAMDSYAAKQDIPVDGKCLLLQIPANVRLPDKYGELGNELTMLPGVVPLGMSDPVDRLRRVADYNRSLKELDMAAWIHGMMGVAFGIVTPPGQALLCKTMVSRPYLNFARMTGMPPQEHAIMSSVVMPAVIYSIDGQSVTGFINLIACQFNMGFAFSPVSYGDHVTLALSVDAENLGDSDSIMDDTMAALQELHTLAIRAAAQ